MKSLLFLLFCGVVAGFLPAAEVQRSAITYQGRLTSTDPDRALNRTVLITFSLYPQATGGTALWRETLAVTPNAEGRFSVTLFDTCGSKEEGIETTLDEALLRGRQNNGLWLGLIVDRDTSADAATAQARELTPRHPVGIVPKAHRARTATRARTDFRVPNTLSAGDVTAGKLSADTCTVDASAAATGLQTGTLSATTLTVSRKLNVEQEMTVNALVLESAPVSPDVVPLGAIILWYGEAEKIPDGWEEVESLIGRFPRGADATLASGNSGGAETVTLEEANLPPHTHTIYYAQPYGTSGYAYASSKAKETGDIWVKTRSEPVTLKPNPNHRADPVSILPPYKALRYIRRIK